MLCPRVGLEILQDHGFYNQSRFWLFFLPAGCFCRRRRGRRKRRSIRRERRWRWCHRLFFFFFKLRHLSSCSLFLQQRNKCISLLLLFFAADDKNGIEFVMREREEETNEILILSLFRDSLFKIFKNSLSSETLSSSLHF